jgi:hypothetical protein
VCKSGIVRYQPRVIGGILSANASGTVKLKIPVLITPEEIDKLDSYQFSFFVNLWYTGVYEDKFWRQLFK